MCGGTFIDYLEGCSMHTDFSDMSRVETSSFNDDHGAPGLFERVVAEMTKEKASSSFVHFEKAPMLPLAPDDPEDLARTDAMEVVRQERDAIWARKVSSPETHTITVTRSGVRALSEAHIYFHSTYDSLQVRLLSIHPIHPLTNTT